MDEQDRPPVIGGEDQPLPATLTFVMAMGALFFVLWFGVYLLLRERW